jgi:two-component system, OmpR family, sensor histidine kinase ChvG
MDLYLGGPERRISRLTVRIIGINATALVMLLIGIVYMGQYQNTLIENSLRTFKTEVELVSASLSEVLGGPEMVGPPNLETAKRMVWRFSRMMDQRVYLFDREGTLIADSDHLNGYDDFERFEDDRPETLYAIQILKKMAKFVLEFLPVRRTLPAYPARRSLRKVKLLVLSC